MKVSLESVATGCVRRMAAGTFWAGPMIHLVKARLFGAGRVEHHVQKCLLYLGH